MASLSKIKLTKGQLALVDERDFEYINQWKWHYSAGYAYRTEYNIRKYGKSGRKILMHRLLLDAPESFQVDHRNGNGLDNRRKNIRLATHSQNQWNKRKGRNNTSGFTGVCWEKQTRKWKASIRIERKSCTIGRFTDITDAVKARDEHVIKHRGEFGRLSSLHY